MTVVLLLLILLSVWMCFYALVKQQGRILLRLDQIEGRTKVAGSALEHPSGETESDELPLNAHFPAFRLPDLKGRTIALEDFCGKRVLLVHWNFECGYCQFIARDLADLDSGLEKRNVQLVLLTYGDSESNQRQAEEHGLKCPMLLINNEKSPSPFSNQGTPVAYLLDEQGRVAAPYASGADQVIALARHAATGEIGAFQAGKRQLQRGKLPGVRPLSESRIERNGLKVGTPAPAFRLPDLQGRMISLEEYRGRRVLLVFSDPQCGPCDELAPHLVRLHEKHSNNGLALILVGRGNSEENRRKAQQHGFQFPIVVQEKWKLSKEYGIFATPVAFLIREDGVIARDVAVGKNAILALAGDGVGASEEESYERIS